MRTLVLSLLILLFAVSTAFALADAGVVANDAGVSSPSAELDNPIESPRAAFDDLKAAKKTSWPLAVLAGLIMLLRTAAKVGAKFKSFGWLAKGKAAVATAGALVVATAAFDVLAMGGSWVSVLTAAAAAGFALLVPVAAPKAVA